MSFNSGDIIIPAYLFYISDSIHRSQSGNPIDYFTNRGMGANYFL